MSQLTPEDNAYEEDQEDSIINIPVVYTEPVDNTNNHNPIYITMKQPKLIWRLMNYQPMKTLLMKMR